MKDKIFGVLQSVGRSFMLPIAVLPVAGLLLGIGGSFTNITMLEAYNLMGFMGPGTVLYAILSVFKAAGSIIFDNLPLLFAMGVALGMAKKEKEVAVLSSAVAFLIMHASIGAMIELNGGTENMLSGATTSVLGITSLQMGVFGGIIVGLGVAALHNKFYKIELPQVLSFFGGTRFVPIISAIVYVGVGLAMFFVWPFIQTGIYSIGDLVNKSGYAGTFLYGVIERALIPFGLHHVFYIPFWQTSLGGTMVVAGQTIEGAQNIFFAQLADPTVTHFSVDATRFMSGKFPMMIFGLPGAALAMYRCADSKKKKVVGGLLLSAALTAMITGITEPIEFTFLFVAPLLYGVHCALAGLSYMLMHILNVGVGMTFSGGLIDLFLFGILQGNDKTNWLYIVLVGIIYFIVYYFLFKFMITKFNLKTPGREDEGEETKLYTRKDVEAKKQAEKSGVSKISDKSIDTISALIVKGLGGKANLSDVDCCATRLRITVVDSKLVNKDVLTQSGAAGVIVKGNGVQVIYGPRVSVIKSNLEDFLESPMSDQELDLEPQQEIKQKAEKQQGTNNTPQESKSVKQLKAPLTGTVVTLADVNDGAFSSGMLGDGAAIQPMVGKVFAPTDGVIGAVTDTKHAVGMQSDDGVEIFIHVGLDTVKLKGEFFDTKVKTGDRVKRGDLLIEFNLKEIEKAGYKTITPVIIGNTPSFTKIDTVAEGKVNAMDDFINIV